MSSIYLDYTFLWFRAIFTQVLQWYVDIYEILGMTNLWIGAVVLAIVFTVVLIPLRGGSGISGGALNEFTNYQRSKKIAEIRRSSSKSKSG